MDILESTRVHQISLNQGQITTINVDDLVLLESYGRVHAWWSESAGSFYARARLRDSGTPGVLEYLHRIIMGSPEGLQVDHRDHNTLNNCRYNLRIATNSQNQCNSKMTSRNTSGYRGVSFCKQTGLWKSSIHIGDTTIWLGRYATAQSASEAYQQAAQKYHGEFRYRPGGFPSTGLNGSLPGPCKP